MRPGQTQAPDLERLAGRLVAAFAGFTAQGQELAITLTRTLAEGEPVTVARLADAVGRPAEQIAGELERWQGVFRDDRDRVIGFMGLTVVEMGNHRLRVDGRELSAWCAWDTLFLPELLDKTVAVRSVCPVTAEEISLEVGPAGVRDLRPAETVVSFLLPDTRFDGGVIQRFCHFVHFFASKGAGDRWTAEHHGTFLLSVADAFELGRLTNAKNFPDCLNRRPAQGEPTHA